MKIAVRATYICRTTFMKIDNLSHNTYECTRISCIHEHAEHLSIFKDSWYLILHIFRCQLHVMVPSVQYWHCLFIISASLSIISVIEVTCWSSSTSVTVLMSLYGVTLSLNVYSSLVPLPLTRSYSSFSLARSSTFFCHSLWSLAFPLHWPALQVEGAIRIIAVD